MRGFYLLASLLVAMAAGCESQTDSTTTSSTGAQSNPNAGGSGGDSGSGGATPGSGGGSANGGAGGGAGGELSGTGGVGGMPTFEEVAFENVTFELPEWVGTTPELVVFQDETDFQNYFGVAAPAAIDWAKEDALFYTEGALPFPGHIATVKKLALREDQAELQIDTALRSPGKSCEVLSWVKPAFQLVRFSAVQGSPQLTKIASPTSFNCAANGASEESNCDEINLCGAGLICGHLTRWSPGFCRPASMHGVFSESVLSTIPDGNTGGLTRQLNATGLATVDTDVIIKVELDHPDWSQLTITLTNPSNNEVSVWAQETPPNGVTTIHRVPTGFSGDESVNGSWSLKIVDKTMGQAGSLKSWELEIVSRLD